jgi:hypothetical protein
MSHPEVLVTEDGNALEVTFELDEAGTISSATVDGQTFEGEDAQLIYNEFEGFTPRDGITSGNSQWSPEDVPSEEDKPGGLMSPPEPEQPPTSVREKAIERLGVTEEDIQEGMDTGEITELDLQVLMEYGDDIYTYLEDKVGDDPDGMQLYRLMTDWAEENKKQLPFNMNFLVDTFRKALNNG